MRGSKGFFKTLHRYMPIRRGGASAAMSLSGNLIFLAPRKSRRNYLRLASIARASTLGFLAHLLQARPGMESKKAKQKPLLTCRKARNQLASSYVRALCTRNASQ
jgi:hypothetical protein